MELQEAPRFLMPVDAMNDKEFFPPYVEFPQEYFPVGVGPGGFDPKTMYMHALVLRNSEFGGMHTMEMKPWVILWLLDHVDWRGLGLWNCYKCGRDLHGYTSYGQKSLCRYCDPKADVE